MLQSRTSRRDWLRSAMRGTMALPLLSHESGFAGFFASALDASRKYGSQLPSELFSADPRQYRLTKGDESFLEEVQSASFKFFWEQASPVTGHVEDRGLADGGPHKNVSSIASTGFGLTALCIADRRGWMKPAAIRERVRELGGDVDLWSGPNGTALKARIPAAAIRRLTPRAVREEPPEAEEASAACA